MNRRCAAVTRWLVAVLALALLGVLLPATAAFADRNRALCNSTNERVDIPDGFVLDGCFDGSKLYLLNTTNIPLNVVVDGSAGTPYQRPFGGVPEIPSLIFTYIDPADQGLVMPGYMLTIPVGAGQGSITVVGTRHNRSYVLVRALATWIPTKPAALVKQFGELTTELSEVWNQWQNCVKDATGSWGDVACEALYYRDVAFALGRYGITAGAKGAFAAVLNVLDSKSWAADSPGEVLKLVSGPRTLVIDARAALPRPAHTTKPPSGGGSRDPSGGSGPQPTSRPVPDGPTTVAETVGGRAATWTNYRNAGGTEGRAIPSGTTVEIACKLRGFAVQNGNTWWYKIASPPWNRAFYVSADAFYNNGSTSGPLKGTPYVDPAVPDC